MVFEQLAGFFLMLFFGFFIGIVFNLYYIFFRKNMKKKKIYLVYVFDILFGIIVGVLGFIVLFYFNYGDFRFYILISIFLGLYIYYKAFFYRGG